MIDLVPIEGMKFMSNLEAEILNLMDLQFLVNLHFHILDQYMANHLLKYGYWKHYWLK